MAKQIRIEHVYKVFGDSPKAALELIAQGAANFLVPFFAGMPVTGTIARTVTNLRSGATSPISAWCMRCSWR